MTSVRIEYIGLPPFKANPGPNRKGARLRQESFRVAAQQVLDAWRTKHKIGAGAVFPWDPMSAKIELIVAYRRANGDNDAANIIGGICDALQGVFYSDDRQIVNVHYSEESVDLSGEDHLIVDVSTSDQAPEGQQSKETAFSIAGDTSIAEEEWDQQLDRAWAAKAKDSGDSIPGPKGAMDAAKSLHVSKLSLSKYKTSQGLLDSTDRLKSKWRRKENNIIRL